MRALLLLTAVMLAIFFGATDALLGVAIFLLLEISLDVKRMALGVLDIYKLFEKQAQEDRDAEEIERIDEQLTRKAGVAENGEVYELPHLTFTWPPKAN